MDETVADVVVSREMIDYIRLKTGNLLQGIKITNVGFDYLYLFPDID